MQCSYYKYFDIPYKKYSVRKTDGGGREYELCDYNQEDDSTDEDNGYIQYDLEEPTDEEETNEDVQDEELVSDYYELTDDDQKLLDYDISLVDTDYKKTRYWNSLIKLADNLKLDYTKIEVKDIGSLRELFDKEVE